MKGSLPEFARLASRDLMLIGLGGALICWPLYGEAQAWSFLCGGLFMALNLLILGWLIGALVTPDRPQKLFIFLVECAKLPLAYCLLYWLCTREYIEPGGLVGGLAALPAAILFRGLASSATPRIRA